MRGKPGRLDTSGNVIKTPLMVVGTLEEGTQLSNLKIEIRSGNENLVCYNSNILKIQRETKQAGPNTGFVYFSVGRNLGLQIPNSDLMP